MHILRVYTDACNEHLHIDRPPIYNEWNVKQHYMTQIGLFSKIIKNSHKLQCKRPF